MKIHFRQQRRRQRGVTLVEACIVMAVGAVLAAAAAPGMQRLLDTRRLDGAATQLATDIQWVRTEAVARNQPVRLSFYTAVAGSCYVIHTGHAAQCDCDAPGPARCSGEALSIRTVSLTSADRVGVRANAASVVFDPLHGTASPAATLRLTGADGREVRHVLNVMGRVRSCSPEAAMSGYRAC